MALARNMLTAVAALALLSGPVAAATSTFRVFLGAREIGTVDYTDADGGVFTVRSEMSNTPLGVGDGLFEAVSRQARTADGQSVRQYLATSTKRVISVLYDASRPIETVVNPISEATDLSDATLAPAGVLDPAMAFGKFVAVHACPDPFGIYDGRRVISVRTSESAATDGKLTCTLDYHVDAGPGHLSPFRFTSLTMTGIYNSTVAQGVNLIELRIDSGLFELRLTR